MKETAYQSESNISDRLASYSAIQLCAYLEKELSIFLPHWTWTFCKHHRAPGDSPPPNPPSEQIPVEELIRKQISIAKYLRKANIQGNTIAVA